MEKSIFPTHTTNSTRITVILTLIVIVEEIADQAGVSAEANATFFAIHLHSLSRITFSAYQLRNCLTIERMILDFIVTVPTNVDFTAAWTLNN
jgi:hypothetical protein